MPVYFHFLFSVQNVHSTYSCFMSYDSTVVGAWPMHLFRFKSQHEDHFRRTVSKCFVALRQLRSIQLSVTPATFQQLITPLVMTRLDYGNATLASLLAHLHDELQAVIVTRTHWSWTIGTQLAWTLQCRRANGPAARKSKQHKRTHRTFESIREFQYKTVSGFESTNCVESETVVFCLFAVCVVIVALLKYLARVRQCSRSVSSSWRLFEKTAWQWWILEFNSSSAAV